MTRKSWFSILFSIMLVISFSLSATAQAGGPTIDLTQDANQDGIPDALAREVALVATSKDKEAAIADMVNRLPYSPETRALQRQAQLLHQQLMQTKDEQTARKIIDELFVLSDKMMADPNYAKTISGLTRLFAPQATARDRVTGAPIKIQAVRWDWLWRGDIMLVRDPDGKLGKFTTFLYGMWYTHAGNYDGNSLVYESNDDGVRLKPLSKWQTAGLYIGLGYDNKRTASQVQASQDWAKGFYGTDGRTPYNYWFPDKQTDSRLYCSQLTWKIHNHIGVDLDSNHWQYQNWVAARWGWWAVWTISNPAVAPDEVGLDSDVTIYSADWN